MPHNTTHKHNAQQTVNIEGTSYKIIETEQKAFYNGYDQGVTDYIHRRPFDTNVDNAAFIKGYETGYNLAERIL